MSVKSSLNRIVMTAITALLLCLSPVSFASGHDYIVPPMVNIAAGEFMMGSDTGRANEQPRHAVSVPAFQLGKYVVTMAEFRKFAVDTGFTPTANCYDHLGENWMSGEAGTATWDKNRYVQSEYQPVTCVTWQDADNYAKWLSKKTGTQYRLPTEQEWEYAVKANTNSPYFWGADPDLTQACRYGNFADQSSEFFASKQYGASYVGFIGHANCDDGEAYNAIVGLYRPNPFGLYDMVGNVVQHLGQCFYEGYQVRTAEEMDLAKCEETSIRGTIWHFKPESHSSRAGHNKAWEPGAMLGFRLAIDGHSDKTHSSTTKFEAELKQAQLSRLANRPTLPAAPTGIQLVKVKSNRLQLSWQPNAELQVTGYDVYQSKSPQAHLMFGFYQPHYTKIATVGAGQNSLVVTLPATGGSFRVVATTATVSSLPSAPAVMVTAKSSDIPGRINMLATSGLDNVLIRYKAAQGADPEKYYLLKFTGRDQLVSSAMFQVNVKQSGWYQLNYQGKAGKAGPFFKLWQQHKLIGEISYDPAIDDKISNRHQVFLEQGSYSLELNVLREGPDRWDMEWLEFTSVKAEPLTASANSL